MNSQNKICKAAGLLFLLLSPLVLSCSNEKETPIVIWTDRAEFASYTELFNATHDVKAVVVYKENTSRSLPPAKDEQTPDIVISSYLNNSLLKKNFSPLGRFLGASKIPEDIFYSSLLSYGTLGKTVYLLPVSFNLSAFVFRSQDAESLPNEHTVTLDEVKKAATSFNEMDEKKQYTKMGFAPSWDADFLYLVSRIYGCSYSEGGSLFYYDADASQKTVSFLRDWTATSNTSNEMEQSFQFRYLYMPKNLQPFTGRSMFTYMTSSDVFSSDFEDSSLAFRWISNEDNVFVEDDMVCLGLYKKALNPSKAGIFLEWFFSEETQGRLMERKKNMALDTVEFGISGGFSSIKSVNKKVLPTYYRNLLGNIPSEENLIIPEPLPNRWNVFKQKIIEPFFAKSLSGEEKTLDDYITDWSRQSF